MSGTTGDDGVLHELELNVRAELALVHTGGPSAEVITAPSEEWLFEEEEAERYEVGLRGLLSAVVGLEDDSRPSVDPAPPGFGEWPDVRPSNHPRAIS